MDRESWIKWLGVPVAIIGSLGISVETFTGLGLHVKLFATAILGAFVIWQVADLIGAALSRPASHIGFGQRERRPKKLAWCLAHVGLIVVAAIFAGLGCLQTERMAIRAYFEKAADQESLVLRASLIRAERIILRLPPDPFVCDIKEMGASLRFVDWETPQRTLEIIRFVSPQSVTISCAGGLSLDARSVEVEGTSDRVFFASEIRQLQIFTLGGGLILWIIGAIRLHLRA